MDPRRKSDEELTPLHTAARHKKETVIRILIPATGDYSDYDGCLVAYLENPYSRPRLSTAQNLFAVENQGQRKDHNQGLSAKVKKATIRDQMAFQQHRLQLSGSRKG